MPDKTTPKAPPDQRRRFRLQAPGRLLGRCLLQPDHLRCPQASRCLRQDPGTRPATSSAKPSSKRAAGIPVPDEAWTVGRYLEYWLENFVKRNRRPATYNLYEMIVRLYLIPGLGGKQRSPDFRSRPSRCSSNQRLEKGDSVRKVQVMRTVLSSALTRAVREELIIRNVARLVELPRMAPGTIRPWSAAEARQFLAASKTDPLYAAFVLLVLYGLRRGEALGLRWEDIDFDAGHPPRPPATSARARRTQPGPGQDACRTTESPLARSRRRCAQARASTRLRTERTGYAWPATDLVFTTRTGRPVEPRNLVRSFRRICDHNKIRLIKVHHLRHTVASLLKELQVPARDAQAILGHTRISTTLEIYTGSAEDAQRDALRKLDGLLDNRES